MLKAVVLPAPLGPINATISPALMENSRLFTATRPPNRRVRFLISRMATHFIPDEPGVGCKSRRFPSAIASVAPPIRDDRSPATLFRETVHESFTVIVPFRRGCADASTRRDRLGYRDRR